MRQPPASRPWPTAILPLPLIRHISITYASASTSVPTHAGNLRSSPKPAGQPLVLLFRCQAIPPPATAREDPPGTEHPSPSTLSPWERSSRRRPPHPTATAPNRGLPSKSFSPRPPSLQGRPERPPRSPSTIHNHAVPCVEFSNGGLLLVYVFSSQSELEPPLRRPCVRLLFLCHLCSPPSPCAPQRRHSCLPPSRPLTNSGGFTQASTARSSRLISPSQASTVQIWIPLPHFPLSLPVPSRAGFITTCAVPSQRMPPRASPAALCRAHSSNFIPFPLLYMILLVPHGKHKKKLSCINRNPI